MPLYMHEFFELILFFDPHGLLLVHHGGKFGRSHGRNLDVFESSDISETGKATPTNISAHACYINTYLHEFFQPILIN